MLNRLIRDASSLNVVSMPTCGNLFGAVPSDSCSASETAVGSKKRLPGSLGFDGLNVSGLNIPLNPPAGMLKFAQMAGPFQKLGLLREFGCPSGVPLAIFRMAETVHPPTTAFTTRLAPLSSVLPLPTGSSQLRADLNTCVRSSGEMLL